MTSIQEQPLPRGLQFVVGFHVISAILWLIGQAGAVVFYDTIASWGFQEPRDATDPAIVQINISIGMTDTLILIPLHVMAAYGIMARQFYGIITSWMAFAVSLYWTAFYWSGLAAYRMGHVYHAPADAFSLVVTIIVFLVAAWGSWYQCRRCKVLVDWWTNDFQGFAVTSVGQPLTLGLKVITGFHLVAILLILLGQTYAIFDYDRVASWGLQVPTDEQDPALKYWNIAVAIQDTLIQLPLHAMAAFGILRRDFYGIISSWMAFGITLYWPIIAMTANIAFFLGGILHQAFSIFDWIYMFVFLGFAVWGSWYECRLRELIAWWKADLEDETTDHEFANEKDRLVAKS